MLTPAEFRILLAQTGRQVTWHQAKAPQQTKAVQAIVSSTSTSAEAIVNAYGLNSYTFQISASDLPVPPEKFDQISDADGERHTVDLVIPHHQRGTGLVVSFTCYAKGR